MKPGRLLLFAAIIPPGLCSPPTPSISTTNPVDIESRGKSSSIPAPSSWPGSRELVTRTDAPPPSKQRLAIKYAYHSALTFATGFGFWGIKDDCKAFHNDGGGDDGSKCVVAAIGTGITLILWSITIANFFMEFAGTIETKVVNYALDFAKDTVAHGAAALGPFLRASQSQPFQPPVKRDGDGHGDDNIFKRAEDHLASVFGVEVRHIGIWDGVMPKDVQSREVKRGEQSKGDTEEEEQKPIPVHAPVPVFGLNLRDQDMHFAYMGQTLNVNGSGSGSALFKMGPGVGPATPKNTRRLRKRDTPPRYNDYYFSHGGFDVTGQATGTGQEVSSNDFDFEWTVEQLMCYMGLLPDPKSHTTQMEAIGMWFQMYDIKERVTMAGGAIAPFSNTIPSAIGWMRPEGSLILDQVCTGQQKGNTPGDPGYLGL